MEPEVDGVRRLAAAIRIPEPPSLADLHRRARRRRARGVGLAAAAVVTALVAGAAVVAATRGDSSTQVATVGSTVALPGQPGWSWITPESMRSRDGSPTGYGRRRGQAGGELLIYLADGGACFDAASCADAQDHFDEDDLRSFVDRPSAITATAPDAPFAGWEVVVVPGSTADLHHGQVPDIDVPGGPSDQDMVGARNLRHALADLAARSDGMSPDRVVLAGSGAGAFGVILAQSTLRTAYPDAELTSILDGAIVPPTGPGLPDCVLERWEQLWDIDVPDAWGGGGGTSGTHPASNVYRRLATRFPDSHFGLLAPTEDLQLRSWYGRGQDCSPAVGPLSAEQMRAGVDGVVALLRDLEPWQSFVVEGRDGDVLASPLSGDPATAGPIWAWISSVIGL